MIYLSIDSVPFPLAVLKTTGGVFRGTCSLPWPMQFTALTRLTQRAGFSPGVLNWVT